MLYPFFYKTIGDIDVEALTKSVVTSGGFRQFDKSWVYQPFQSDYLQKYLDENLFGLILVNGEMRLSAGKESEFHVDPALHNLQSHRVLISLADNFYWEWFHKGKLYRHKPKIGQVVVFNNQVPHRFVLVKGSDEVRMTVFLNLIDPTMLQYSPQLEGIRDAGAGRVHAEVMAQIGSASVIEI
ncbi:MAG: hypothetical protein K0R29_1731 [Pseudobdellovibrio sp.]|jgi:hypothetical protein|nr:hypothetical protein [Pseudobdellovibrio sp.]